MEVRKLERHLLAARTGDDPLGQSLAHAREDVGKPGGIIEAFRGQASSTQRCLYRAGHGPDTLFLVGEQVDVLGTTPADQ